MMHKKVDPFGDLAFGLCHSQPFFPWGDRTLCDQIIRKKYPNGLPSSNNQNLPFNRQSSRFGIALSDSPAYDSGESRLQSLKRKMGVLHRFPDDDNPLIGGYS